MLFSISIGLILKEAGMGPGLVTLGMPFLWKRAMVAQCLCATVNLRNSSSKAEEASLAIDELLSDCRSFHSSSREMSGPVALKNFMEEPDRSISKEC